jgi:succinoglycan biosynthesis transport protein ExoP
MNLNQFFLIMWARRRLILATMLVVVSAAVAASLLIPPRYLASASVVVEFKGVDPITGAIFPAQLMPSYMATQVDIIQSRAVALKVAKALKLSDNPDMKAAFLEQSEGRGSIENWLADGLLGSVDVKPSHESSVVDINFVDRDANFAAAAANGFAQAYIQTNLDLKTAPARESAAWYDGQLKELRDQYESAQARLSKYQTDKGITSTEQKLDVEVAKLSEISTQLVQVQAQSYEGASRQKQLDEFISKHRSVDSLPEVLSSPVIQELKARLSIAEARFSQAPNTLGKNHPEYQRMQSEVDNLHKKLDEEITTAASVINNNLRITQGRERELRDAVAAQKTRLLELNRHRDELGILMKEVENAQHAYESASQRHVQTSLESRVDQGNVVVLNPAVPPVKPSFPKLPLNVLLAIVAGMLLGVPLALLREVLDRRIRGVGDFIDAVGMPVWGVMDDTSALSRVVDRKNKSLAKAPRTLTPVQEPALG